MVEKEVAILIVLVRQRRCAVGAVVRRIVDDGVPGAVEEEAGPINLIPRKLSSTEVGFQVWPV